MSEHNEASKLHLTRRLFSLSSIAMFTGLPVSVSAAICPGVDAETGARKPLIPPYEVVPDLPVVRSIPDEWRLTALEIIARFESGQPDVHKAYGNVSLTDVISLGFLQWNHNTGSLYTSLLKGAGQAEIDAAPQNIKIDIVKFIEIGLNKAPKSAGAEVIKGWKSGSNLKPDIRISLETWLRSERMRKRQDILIDATLGRALQMADAWHRDMNDAFAEDPRAFYSFTDAVVFNGNLAGLWTNHVKAYRAAFPNSGAMMDSIGTWVDNCNRYQFQGTVGKNKDNGYTPTYKKLYRRNETLVAFNHWKALLAQGSKRINEDALNLIALGFLRALQSSGNDRPRGFHGVFQLDVLNRRGMMATGVGVLNGETRISELYPV